MKTLCVVPYRTKIPVYVKDVINHYSFQPEKIDYIPNRQEQYIFERYNSRDNCYNQMDWKVIESFQTHRPTKFLVVHPSDHILNPYDLEYMIKTLNSDKKAAVIGIHPVNFQKNQNMGMHHAYNDQNITGVARIHIWRCELFDKYLYDAIEVAADYSSIPYDPLIHLMWIVYNEGYRILTAPLARMQKINLTE